MTHDELFAVDPMTGEESTSYSVSLEKFEGPLDLLLYLIHKNEIDIYDIPIASITRQYLEYIEMMKVLDLDVASEFILMAATLIRIKSRLLLPVQQDEQEEDPREELILALLEYKKFKEASAVLHKCESTERSILKRSDFCIVQGTVHEEFILEATVFDLLAAFKKVLDDLEREKQHVIQVDDIRLEDRIAHVMMMISGRNGIEFKELFMDNPVRLAIVVTFIAVLELVKQRLIVARQAVPFGEIRVYRWEETDDERA